MVSLSYNKKFNILEFKNNNLSLCTRLDNCNGNLKKVNEFDKGYLALQLEDINGIEYEEYIPMDEFLKDLCLGDQIKTYFKNIKASDIVLLKGD